jgi:hypothetical protein
VQTEIRGQAISIALDLAQRRALLVANALDGAPTPLVVVVVVWLVVILFGFGLIAPRLDRTAACSSPPRRCAAPSFLLELYHPFDGPLRIRRADHSSARAAGKLSDVRTRQRAPRPKHRDCADQVRRDPHAPARHARAQSHADDHPRKRRLENAYWMSSSSTRACSAASTRIKPRRGNSRSMITYTVSDRMRERQDVDQLRFLLADVSYPISTGPRGYPASNINTTSGA